MRMGRLLWALLVLGWLGLGSQAAAEVPAPAHVQVLGQIELDAQAPQGYGVIVYRATEHHPKGKGSRTQTYMELRQRKGAAWTLRNKLRLPSHVDERFQLSLHKEDLGKDHHVLRFEARPPRQALELDQFQAWFDARGHHPVIWSGALDAVEPRQRLIVRDIDGDGAEEIIQGQQDAGVFFCGQSQTVLFPRVWDFRRQRFEETRQAVRWNQDAPQLTASLDAQAPGRSHFPGLAAFRSASSDVRDTRAGLRSRVSQPTGLSDGDDNSVWIEGAPGDGAGEFVTANINPAWPLRGLRLMPGAVANEKVWGSYGRPREVLLSFAGGERFRVKLPAAGREELRERGGLYVALPKPVQTHCMTVMLLEVETPPAGRGQKHTALSEVSPLIDLDYASRQTAVEQLVQQLSDERDHRRRQSMIRLASGLGPELGEAVLTNLKRELSTQGGRPDLDLLLPLIHTAPTEQGGAMIERLLAWEPLQLDEQAALQRSIALRGQRYLDTLLRLGLDQEQAPLVRARAVEIFARAAPPERTPDLLPLLGQGDEPLRLAVVRGLSRAPRASTDALLEVAATQADSPASHDALWALERVVRHHGRGKPVPLEGAEKILVAYNKTQDVQIRIRAVKLLGRVTLTNGDAFLIAILQGQERPEIRRLAAHALRLYPGDKASDALSQALKDKSPLVRFAALKGLEERVNLPRVIQAVTAYAKAETWRQGLDRAYKLMALSEQRHGADYLYSLLEGSDQARIQLVLSSLNSARNNIRALPLSRMIINRQLPEQQRTLATRALTWGKDPDSERLLVDLVTGEQPNERKVRIAAARALGTRRSKLGLDALMAAVTDNTDPSFQRACIRSLGRYQSPKAMRQLIGLRSKVTLRVRPVLEEAIDSLGGATP